MTPGPVTAGRTLRPWLEASDLLVAVIPLALTVLLLISGFTPILRTLSDPNTTWTGFAYQALLGKLSAYALATYTPASTALSAQAQAATLARLRGQALSSLGNPREYADLALVEGIGTARLSRALELFRAADTGSAAARHARLSQAIEEASMLNEQAHERIHQVQALHARQLERLRLVLLLAAALSGVLSTALIWRALRLWRTERQTLDSERELLSLASHELRRPLQSLMLATDLLRGAQTPEDRLRYLSVVESSATQLASRTNLEQLETMYGQVHLDWQTVDLGDLLLEFRGPRTDVQIPARPLLARGDPARLRQIIENLHENALRYSAGSVFLTVVVNNGRPELQVCDSGPGIDPAHMERLFLPRERGSGQRPGQPGVPGHGLGLTIARRLAQAHGADLTLKTAPGGGTLAALRLAAPPYTDAPRPNPVPRDVQAATGRQKNAR